MRDLVVIIALFLASCATGPSPSKRFSFTDLHLYETTYKKASCSQLSQWDANLKALAGNWYQPLSNTNDKRSFLNIERIKDEAKRAARIDKLMKEKGARVHPLIQKEVVDRC